jgi:thiamine biosynthesis lipoprotein
MQFNDSFRAMNTDIDVLVGAMLPPAGLFVSLRLLFEQQEQRFSRFRPTSLLSRLNAGECIEDSHFAQVVRMALEAHEFAAGLYNPMILPALQAAGYDRSFDDVSGGEPRSEPVPDPARCLALDGDCVRLLDGALDLGGIVKGWTVDLAFETFAGEYPDMFLNAGGDLRCSGEEEGVDGWFVALELPHGGICWEGALRGAVATSTTAKRRWRTDSGSEAHHLIDPRSGLPADSPFVQVTAWGVETWRSEVWAKAVLIAGEAAAEHALLAGHPLVAVEHDGTVRRWGTPERYR